MHHQQKANPHADDCPMPDVADGFRDASAVEDRIAELIALQDQTLGRIATLQRRLISVLMAEDPKSSGGDIGTGASLSPLCDELDARIACEHAQIFKLDDLIARLTV